MYTLVIVDDEQKILDGIADLFPWDNIGFNVAGKFTNAKLALDYIDKNPVDVVLTDIKMPGMDGLSFAEKIKKDTESFVIILSSYSDYEFMRRALKVEVDDYLLKPINYGDLSECFDKVREALDEKNQVQLEDNAPYYDKIIRAIDNYIEENFQKANLVNAAETVGISAGYLSKIYKEKKGIGFQEKLNCVRMKKAVSMLMDVSFKSYEIAYNVGYDSPKNFTRAFKAYYGVTPRDYRNGDRGKEKICSENTL
ncbi:MAG: response regulator [Butyrivibrio sp.]|jgi:YesN/AraC family two-component response regulator|nr:response regulator [Butyrivibrio sp.]